MKMYIINAIKTIKAFNELFDLKEGAESWLDFRTENIDDSILELKGFELQKYIYNNFGCKLFKKRYSKHEKEYRTHHKIVRCTDGNEKMLSISYFGNYEIETSCVLTGMCYDDNILQPIYDFLYKRTFNDTSFNDLLNNCFNEIKNTIENEIKYIQGDEYITEQIIDNDYEFNENGKRI